jgi:hypothetical protein
MRRRVEVANTARQRRVNDFGRMFVRNRVKQVADRTATAAEGVDDEVGFADTSFFEAGHLLGLPRRKGRVKV